MNTTMTHWEDLHLDMRPEGISEGVVHVHAMVVHGCAHICLVIFLACGALNSELRGCSAFHDAALLFESNFSDLGIVSLVCCGLLSSCASRRDARFVFAAFISLFLSLLGPADQNESVRSRISEAMGITIEVAERRLLRGIRRTVRERARAKDK